MRFCFLVCVWRHPTKQPPQKKKKHSWTFWIALPSFDCNTRQHEFAEKMGYELTRFQGDVDEELVCPICSGVLEEPVQVIVDCRLCTSGYICGDIFFCCQFFARRAYSRLGRLLFDICCKKFTYIAWFGVCVYVLCCSGEEWLSVIIVEQCWLLSLINRIIFFLYIFCRLHCLQNLSHPQLLALARDYIAYILSSFPRNRIVIKISAFVNVCANYFTIFKGEILDFATSNSWNELQKQKNCK